MKQINISPKDLMELESIQGTPKQNMVSEEALKVLAFIKTRNVTTRKILEIKLGISHSIARSTTDILVRAQLVEKNYAFIKGENGAKAKTAVYTVNENGRKRNNKKI